MTHRARAASARGFVATLVAGVALAIHGAGCDERNPAEASAYERCDSELPAAPCGDGTVCLGVNPLGGSVEEPGQICTEDCLADADCPPASGFDARCEAFTIGRRCVLHCADAPSEACPGNLYCTDTARQNGEKVRVCL